jgi:hypothetical protein
MVIYLKYYSEELSEFLLLLSTSEVPKRGAWPHLSVIVALLQCCCSADCSVIVVLSWGYRYYCSVIVVLIVMLFDIFVCVFLFSSLSTSEVPKRGACLCHRGTIDVFVEFHNRMTVVFLLLICLLQCYLQYPFKYLCIFCCCCLLLRSQSGEHDSIWALS